LYLKGNRLKLEFRKKVGYDIHQVGLSTVVNLALMARLFRICKMVSNELLDSRNNMVFKGWG